MSGYDSDLEYLDGPGLAAWLKDNLDLSDLTNTHPALYEQLGTWRRGKRATVWAADTFLITFGRHPSELPADLFLPARRAKFKSIPDEIRRRAIERAAETTTEQAARELGVSERSIRNWRRELEEAA